MLSFAAKKMPQADVRSLLVLAPQEPEVRIEKRIGKQRCRNPLGKRHIFKRFLISPKTLVQPLAVKRLLILIELLLHPLVALLHGRCVGVNLVKGITPLVEAILGLRFTPENTTFCRIAGRLAPREGESRSSKDGKQKELFHNVKSMNFALGTDS